MAQSAAVHNTAKKRKRKKKESWIIIILMDRFLLYFLKWFSSFIFGNWWLRTCILFLYCAEKRRTVGKEAVFVSGVSMGSLFFFFFFWEYLSGRRQLSSWTKLKLWLTPLDLVPYICTLQPINCLFFVVVVVPSYCMVDCLFGSFSEAEVLLLVFGAFSYNFSCTFSTS